MLVNLWYVVPGSGVMGNGDMEKGVVGDGVVELPIPLLCAVSLNVCVEGEKLEPSCPCECVCCCWCCCHGRLWVGFTSTNEWMPELMFLLSLGFSVVLGVGEERVGEKPTVGPTRLELNPGSD